MKIYNSIRTNSQFPHLSPVIPSWPVQNAQPPFRKHCYEKETTSHHPPSADFSRVSRSFVFTLESQTSNWTNQLCCRTSSTTNQLILGANVIHTSKSTTKYDLTSNWHQMHWTTTTLIRLFLQWETIEALLFFSAHQLVKVIGLSLGLVPNVIGSRLFW